MLIKLQLYLSVHLHIVITIYNFYLLLYNIVIQVPWKFFFSQKIVNVSFCKYITLGICEINKKELKTEK